MSTKQGLSKHRKSGHSGKSPKLRMALKLDAERTEPKQRPSGRMFGSVGEAFGANRGNRR